MQSTDVKRVPCCPRCGSRVILISTLTTSYDVTSVFDHERKYLPVERNMSVVCKSCGWEEQASRYAGPREESKPAEPQRLKQDNTQVTVEVVCEECGCDLRVCDCYDDDVDESPEPYVYYYE